MRRIGLLVSSVGSVSQIGCTWSFDHREDSVQYGRVCDRHFGVGDDVQEMSSLYRSHGSDGFWETLHDATQAHYFPNRVTPRFEGSK